ncbi:MAG: peptide-methionine (S)-S-oxide reductase MsrA [Planctomycetes bacterium]|nr:peptide-methionine (S)-S-oxide reductase MsrA [Planctomycetota bacterium]
MRIARFQVDARENQAGRAAHEFLEGRAIARLSLLHQGEFGFHHVPILVIRRTGLPLRARDFLSGGTKGHILSDEQLTRNRKRTGKRWTVANNTELATLAGGCFWCLEAVFEQVVGVAKVESGYAGGATDNPTYRQVCGGDTGHAEVVQITFDPDVISYLELLDIFFVIHDPTTLNRQGADAGTQYRSAIFYHSPAQHALAATAIAELNAAGIWPRPIVTTLEPMEKFYRAEDYHQGYFRANPAQPYCQAVVEPKVAKFRKKFLSKMKSV